MAKMGNDSGTTWQRTRLLIHEDMGCINHNEAIAFVTDLPPYERLYHRTKEDDDNRIMAGRKLNQISQCLKMADSSKTVESNGILMFEDMCFSSLFQTKKTKFFSQILSFYCNNRALVMFRP
jgi:hypothetical protein